MKVPASVLLAPGLSAAARVIWLASFWVEGDLTPAALAAASGLTLPTVRRGLAELAGAGWGPGARGIPAPIVEMPTALLAARRVGAQAKLVYGVLQMAPGFSRREFSITYRALCGVAQVRQGTLKASLDDLIRTGWLRMRVSHGKAADPALSGARS